MSRRAVSERQSSVRKSSSPPPRRQIVRPESPLVSPQGRSSAQKARRELGRAEKLPKKLVAISEGQKSCPKSSPSSPKGTVVPSSSAELRSGFQARADQAIARNAQRPRRMLVHRSARKCAFPRGNTRSLHILTFARSASTSPGTRAPHRPSARAEDRSLPRAVYRTRLCGPVLRNPNQMRVPYPPDM